MRVNVKHILLLIILFIMSIPLIQKSVELFPEADPLVGAVYANHDTIFSLENWWEGDFQRKKEAYLEQQFKQRNFLIRLNNQINFLAFKKLSAKDIYVGNKNFLFQGNYIKAYMGSNFLGEDIIQEKVRKLKMVQDTLNKLGIYLELSIAPSKVRYYPELVSDEWRLKENPINNYKFIRKECIKQGVRLFDVNEWFVQMKPKHKYPLFPKTGVHWNNYGSVLYTDSLVKRVKYYSDISLPRPAILSVNTSTKLTDVDNDLGAVVNLLDSIPVDSMPYPTYTWIVDTTKTKVNAMFVADSYLWNVYYQGLTVNIFSDISYYYYNKTIYNDKSPFPTGTVDNKKIKEEIEKNKVVVLLIAEPNLEDLGWGFIEWAYQAYYGAEAKTN